MEQEETHSLLAQVLRYFAQGFLFSLLFTGLAIAWVFLLAFLLIIGLWIGLIIGFLILLFVIGALNAGLTRWIWHTPVRTDWKSLLVHGFILFIALIIFGIPNIIVLIAVPSLAMRIVLFLVYCFIDGFIARVVAEHYEESVRSNGQSIARWQRD